MEGNLLQHINLIFFLKKIFVLKISYVIYISKFQKGVKLMEKTKTRIPLRHYVEFHFMKFHTLSKTQLAMLIYPMVKSEMPFDKLQPYISVILNLLRKQEKIEKIGNKEWKWVG